MRRAAHTLWYAHSPAIVHSRVMKTLVWMRVPGDVVFAVGGLLLAVYALPLLKPSRRPSPRTAPLERPQPA